MQKISFIMFPPNRKLMCKENKQLEDIYSVLDFRQGFFTYKNKVSELTDFSGFFQQ